MPSPLSAIVNLSAALYHFTAAAGYGGRFRMGSEGKRRRLSILSVNAITPAGNAKTPSD